MKPRYFIQTYGCQMNVHDSERMAGMLDHLGYDSTDAPERADVILLNTCAVRERPEHKLYSELGILRHLKNDNPNLIIGVAGCMAQREADTIRRRVPEVDILLGPRNLHHLPQLVKRAGNRMESDGLDLECDPTPVTPVRRSNTISAFVDVVFGCNFGCTYCAVPSARGKEISRRPGEVLDEIRQLNDLGYREITLLGQTVNAYGHDLGRWKTASASISRGCWNKLTLSIPNFACALPVRIRCISTRVWSIPSPRRKACASICICRFNRATTTV
jgi:tRNA-2-methylthio-N6-dimethylallyladenosine synthase